MLAFLPNPLKPDNLVCLAKAECCLIHKAQEFLAGPTIPADTIVGHQQPLCVWGEP